MRGCRAIWGLIGLLLLWSSSALAWRNVPWHVVDYYYRMPEVTDFRTLSMEVEIRGDVHEGESLYISPITLRVGGMMFYFGMQTDLWNGTTGKWVGPGLIFSRFGPQDRGDTRIAPDGGWAETSSTEGGFASVRRAYPWGEGRYTYKIETRLGESGGLWLDLAMTDHQRNRRIDIGSLRLPVFVPARMGQPVSFVEFYRHPRDPARPNQYVSPRLTVTFGPPTVNGAITPLGGDVYKEPNIPPFARLTPLGDRVLVELGGAVPTE